MRASTSPLKTWTRRSHHAHIEAELGAEIDGMPCWRVLMRTNFGPAAASFALELATRAGGLATGDEAGSSAGPSIKTPGT